MWLRPLLGWASLSPNAMQIQEKKTQAHPRVTSFTEVVAFIVLQLWNF